MFYGASDFLYNAKVIGLSSSIAVSLTLASLHYSWGLAGLWTSMIFVYFGIRVIGEFWNHLQHTGEGCYLTVPHGFPAVCVSFLFSSSLPEV